MSYLKKKEIYIITIFYSILFNNVLQNKYFNILYVNIVLSCDGGLYTPFCSSHLYTYCGSEVSCLTEVAFQIWRAILNLN